MAKRTLAFCICAVMTGAMFVGCSQQTATADTPAPPAPEMPDGWTITSDISFPPDEVRRVGSQLGGELTALRNTDYEVNGMRVRLNTIVAVDSENAEKVMIRLLEMKPEQFLLRRGLTIYEFVGANDAIPEMDAGRAHLQAS